MNRAAIAIAGAAIAVVSFAIGRGTAPPARAPALQRAESMGLARDQPATDCSDDALRACERKLALAEAVFRSQEHDKVGDPVPFPDGLAPQYTPDGFEDAVRAALADCDSPLELGHVDCSEFPCLAFFRPGAVSYGHQADALWKCDAWSEQFSSSAGGGNDMFMTANGMVEYTYISPTPGVVAFDENLGKRLRARGTDGKAQVMADVDGRDLTDIEQVDLAIAMMRDAGADEMVRSLESQRAALVAAENASP
jgi:hypothetical protein